MARESEVATSVFSIVLGEMQEMRDSMLCLEQSWKALIAERDEIRDERNHAVSALAEQVAVLRKERDEARRQVCAHIASEQALVGIVQQTMDEVAATRGWDCFRP